MLGYYFYFKQLYNLASTCINLKNLTNSNSILDRLFFTNLFLY